MRVVLKIHAWAKTERIEQMIKELNKTIAHDFNDVIANVELEVT